MRKGEETRRAILDHAAIQAATVGLEGLSIGGLAQELRLSKSGLFAHFQSKEALQIAIIENEAERFSEHVVRPALRAPRGLPRVQTLVERWLSWGTSDSPHGCFFVAASSELDDRPGPVREALVSRQKDWMELLAQAIRGGVTQGHFRPDTDPEQLAFELYGIMLSCHHRRRLLAEPDAEARARRSVDRLLASVIV
jgi:AcrR family transcriptional regulator